MDIESECYPCIPMSSAIQLNAASLIGNHHLSNSTLTSPSSSISSISSLCNSSLSSTTNSQSTNKSDAQQFTPGRRGRKSKQQQANIIVTNCNSVNKVNKSQGESKNSTLTALLNCSPLISNSKANSNQIACNLPPTPPASNSDSDCEINSHSNGDRARTSDKPSSGKPGRPSNINHHNDASNKQVKRQRANNCSILVQSGSSVINLTQQLSPSSLKRLTVNTSPNGNSIEVNSNHPGASYSPSSSNYHLMNGGLKLDASPNLMHHTSAATHRSHRAGIQSMASLISCQPKTAASGTPVILTEEEKRTLIAEGNYRSK